MRHQQPHPVPFCCGPDAPHPLRSGKSFEPSKAWQLNIRALELEKMWFVWGGGLPLRPGKSSEPSEAGVWQLNIMILDFKFELEKMCFVPEFLCLQNFVLVFFGRKVKGTS